MRPEDRIGRTASEFEVVLERFQLRLFAQAIGEQRPEYVDVAAARAAGYRDLPAPPSFPFTVALRAEDPFDLLRLLEVDLETVLHGEQSFAYARPLCAGDRVRVSRKVIEAYEKKGGVLQFFVVEARYEDPLSGELYCAARQTIVSRPGGA